MLVLRCKFMPTSLQVLVGVVAEANRDGPLADGRVSARGSGVGDGNRHHLAKSLVLGGLVVGRGGQAEAGPVVEGSSCTADRVVDAPDHSNEGMVDQEEGAHDDNIHKHVEK